MRAIGILVLLGACDSQVTALPEIDENAAPELLRVAVTCDEATGRLSFEAEVIDADGDLDVAEIQAFVYDEVSEAEQATAALSPREDGLWTALLPAGTPGFDCSVGSYSADFVVQDASGASDSMTAFAHAGG